MNRLAVVLALSLLTGCMSGFREEHYFRATNRRTGETVNYFRLTVSGWDGGTSSRFVAGIYDERAVDFFFNEIRTGETLQPLLATAVRDSTEIELRPMGANADSGAFVLILSTNAKSVADTLGEFAENQLIADAMTNLINRDTIKANRKFLAVRQTSERRGESLRKHLDELFAELEKTQDSAAAISIAEQIVQTIGAASPSPTFFDDLEDVRPWVKAQLALLPKDDE